MTAANDFIETYEEALPAEVCAAIIERMQTSSDLAPGQVGSGVFPELKNSRDISINNRADWADVQQSLNVAVYSCLLQYIRRYPYTLIAPMMLQTKQADGRLKRLNADDVAAMDNQALGKLAMTCLRPGNINLQWYKSNEGGYPYWHCELFPRDASHESLHRHLLWTIYLNDGFDQGETEFLYQDRKVKPATGSLLIAPAAFTHTHRGNRPSNGDKFIATSWILFQRAEVLYGSQ